MIGKIAVVCLIGFLMNASGLPAQGQNSGSRNSQSGWAFLDIIPGQHRGKVSALIHTGNAVLSAWEDGFLEIWNTRSGAAEERFQLSSFGISAMAQRPGKSEICIIESDGLGQYRISAWDYVKRENIFTLRFRDPITYISYSARGNFIIAARIGRTGVVFLNSETGEVIRSPEGLTVTAAFAATGRSERNMIAYFNSGALSYWDLESGNETNRFQAPANLRSPVMFANNRYLAGLDSQGLAVIDAASGALVTRNSSVSPDSLLASGGDSDFYCVSFEGSTRFLYRFTMDRNGNLRTGDRFRLPANAGKASAISANGSIALGAEDGAVLLVSQRGQFTVMDVKNQVRIIETAVSGSVLAYLAENNTLGFLPLEYFRLNAGETLHPERNDSYTRITPLPDDPDSEGKFLFWQNGNTRSYPVIRSSGGNSALTPLSEIPLRFPLREAAAAAGKILFLDSSGNISVVPIRNTGAARVFSFSSIGSMDADFINGENIILGRSAVSGNTPFLMININTGETVPIAYPSQAGVMVYCGASGNIYAAAVDQDGTGITTSIIKLDISNPAQSQRMVEFQGEDTQFSLAESGAYLAATIGGEGASVYTSADIRKFERTPGLPLRLISGGQFFITLDAEGNICWHDAPSGRLLAVFRLYQNEWILRQEGGESTWGAVSVN
jgi:WD40 repeat protein